MFLEALQQGYETQKLGADIRIPPQWRPRLLSLALVSDLGEVERRVAIEGDYLLSQKVTGPARGLVQIFAQLERAVVEKDLGALQVARQKLSVMAIPVGDAEEQQGRLSWLERLRQARPDREQLTPYLDLEVGILTCEGIALLLQSRVVGQSAAVEAIAPLIYRHWGAMTQRDLVKAKRMKRSLLRRLPFLLTGETGCGKTYLLRTIGELLEIPVVHVDASSLVESGIVGRTIGDVFKPLYRQREGGQTQAEYAIIHLDEADKVLSGKSMYSTGVQAELLKLLEGVDEYQIPTQGREDFPSGKSFPTQNLLFCLSGSFQEEREQHRRAEQQVVGFCSEREETVVNQAFLLESGVMKELVGRVGKRVELQALTLVDVYAYLGQPHSPLMQEIAAVYESHHVSVSVSKAAKECIAQQAISSGLGMRTVHHTCAELFDRYVLPVMVKAEVKSISIGVKQVRDVLALRS